MMTKTVMMAMVVMMTKTVDGSNDDDGSDDDDNSVDSNITMTSQWQWHDNHRAYRVESLVARVFRPDDLQQSHNLHRIEEMQPHELIGSTYLGSGLGLGSGSGQGQG